MVPDNDLQMKVVFKLFTRVSVLPYASSSSSTFTDFARQVGTRPLEGVFGAQQQANDRQETKERYRN